MVGAKVEVLLTVYWLACGASYRQSAEVFDIIFQVGKRWRALVLVFARLAGHDAFEHAAGAIDGCRIRIIPPGEPQKGAFLDVYMGNPGSVLRRSPMYRESLYPPAGYFLLGDRGYPCLQRPVCLLTPYRQSVTGRI
ncbi:hypothetical protein WMY93_031755 [Mugilogobius chulae]|uniref:DDE Tnp4 domain-containing protein n=1 Tax=Mugilogobius chulae TaxID=88201 RepID=A0AAW0MD38_9GOBI